MTTNNITNYPNEQSNRTKTLWKLSLFSATRASLACMIVGSVTLYGPKTIRDHQVFAFPAFAYVTVILIITNAALGDTMRGCWNALCATAQGMIPSILCLLLVGPTRLTTVSTSMVLAISAFFIALPEWTHVVAKRIALGQTVILYVVGYINKRHTQPVLHPIHVATSTALGAFSCFLALLLPFPRLAYFEVKQNSKLFAENISERLKLFVKAFCAQDKESSQSLIAQTKFLATNGRKFLECIKIRQESMKWERYPIKFLRPYCENPGDRFQELETSLRGMELALINSPNPIPVLNEELKDGIMSRFQVEIDQNLEQIKSHLPCETVTVPESVSVSRHAMPINSIGTFENDLAINQTDLSSYFFLFCMKLLHTQARAINVTPIAPKSNTTPLQKQQDQPNETVLHQNGLSFTNVWANWPDTFSKKRLVPALKCSLSLGLAVLFGLYYSIPDGFWAGLPVAISHAATREPTFKVANIKFQGTVIGNVYGVLVCFVFQRAPRFRFLGLFPWFVFTSFLQQSKMYGQAGSVSAVIGAVLILGRTNFGTPKDFAIARIVETFIGLFCAIVVELLLQPTRASSLAKVQLSRSIGALHNAVSSLNLGQNSKPLLLEAEKQVKAEVTELGKYVSEAEMEPNFWFVPFHSACFGKLMTSLRKMNDLLAFVAHSIGSIEEQIQKRSESEFDKFNDDLKHVGKMISSSLKRMREISSIKSLRQVEKDMAKRNISCDIELGKSSHNQLNLDEKEMGKIISSLLEHIKEIVEKIQLEEDESWSKFQVVMNIGALGFCLSELMKETREIENGIKELLQWDNPTTQINLKEISCKINALYN